MTTRSRTDWGETELSEAILREKFSSLLEDAALAFIVDTSYATEIITKARTIVARKEAKK